MELNNWKQRNRNAKKYAHFDEKVSLDKVWNYIKIPENIISHGFYPFIHYEKKFNKYKKGEIVSKSRELCYSAHIDRYIYSYYGNLLNQIYNKYAKEHSINDVALAYRDNLGKSNIHFAKQAIQFIRSSNPKYVIIGDFTHFFDNLQHNYLKTKICELMDLKILPNDYYAVFKNITKYSKWKLEDILDINKIPNNDKGILELNAKKTVFEPMSFRNIKKNNPNMIEKNNNSFGIPQGSAISAVLSNIYMIEFDTELYKMVKNIRGLYMRYSDDFIIVLPKQTEYIFKQQYEEIMRIIDSIPNLKLQAEKTQVFSYCESTLQSCNSLVLDNISNGSNIINYLGFSFDGKEVTIRDKTVSKYYYKLHRKLKTIVKQEGYVNGKRISCKNIYDKYSEKGASRNKITGEKAKGNFISYVQRAEAIFGEKSLSKKTRRHMLIIRRGLDKAFKG